MKEESENYAVEEFFFQAEDGIRDIGVTGVQTCALPIYSLFLLFSLAYYIDLFMILGFTDPFLDLKSPMMMSTSYKVLFLIFTLLLIYLLSYFNHQSKEYLKHELKKEQQAYIANLETYGKHLEKLYKGVKVFQLDYLKRLERL